MKYGVGECLADYGFTFLEKIHEPIFLIHRLGRVTRMNESARKLISVAKINISELDKIIISQVQALFPSRKENYRRLKIGNGNIHLIARALGNSDFILVEVRR